MARIDEGKPKTPPRRQSEAPGSPAGESADDAIEIHDPVEHPRFDRRWLAASSFGIGALAAALLFVTLPLLPYSQNLLKIDERVRTLGDQLDTARRQAASSSVAKADQRVTELRRALDGATRELAALSLPATFWLRLVRRDGGWISFIGAWIAHMIFALVAGSLLYALRLRQLGVIPGLALRGGLRPTTCPFRDLRRSQLLRHWSQTGSVDAVRGANESLAGFADTRLAYFFVPLQWAVWLQPILGFIGTVLGVSMSIDSLQLGIRMIFVDSNISPAVLDRFNSGFAALAVSFDTTCAGLLGLALTGTTSILLRRRALGAMARIDEEAHDFIARELPALNETKDAAGEEHERRVVRLVEWCDDKARPALEREFDEADAFRKWAREELPKILRRAGGDQSKSLTEVIQTTARRLASRMGGYGELIARFSRSQAAEIHAIRRIGEFVLQSVYEAGHARPDDPFWRQLLLSLERPLRHRSDMVVVQAANPETSVEALALGSGSARLAVANRSTVTGETRILVHSLDVTDAEVLEFHTHGHSDADGSVVAVDFDARSRWLAFGLIDGTVGVFDLASGGVAQVTLSGALSGPECLAWLGGETSAIVCAVRPSLEATTTLTLVRFRTTTAREGEFDLFSETAPWSPDLEEVAGATLRFDGLEPQSLASTHGSTLVVLAGVERGASRLRALRFERGEWVEEWSAEVPGHPAGFRSVTVVGQREDRLLCGMVDGMVVDVSLARGEVLREASFGSAGATILVVEDPSARFVAVGAEAREALSLIGSAEWDSVQSVPAHAPLALATASCDGDALAVAGEDGHVAFWRFPDYVVTPDELVEPR